MKDIDNVKLKKFHRHPVRRFTCDKYEYHDTTKSSLNKHISKHHEVLEEPRPSEDLLVYICQYCEFKDNCQAAYDLHMLNTHAVQTLDLLYVEEEVG